MSVILGIDVGGSTTKIVGFSSGEELVGTLQVEATDQLTSMYGAIGNFLQTFGLSLGEVSKIVLTGVGASFVSGDVYGIPTHKVAEFEAIGLGGARLANLSRALVVSMGTGSAFVRVRDGAVSHIGGSGVGGGALLGLASRMIDEKDVAYIAEIAMRGNLANVDLAVQDISGTDIPNLPPNITAANFGNVRSIASKSDIALGLINMVFQTVGMLAVFACLDSASKDIVLTGALTVLPQARRIFDGLADLHHLNFIIPPHSAFATAIGAVVPHLCAKKS